ncbi:MAG: DUF86 domain-containing protein [Candidatus Jorgensenbacteria bacterium]
MNKDPRVFLLHILEYIELVEKDIAGVAKDEFKTNRLLQDAVVRRIEVIGEAAKNLPEDFKSQHPEIPWRQIAGTRDFIIHEYFSIDLDLVWEITRKDLPDLRGKISALLG